MRFYNALSDFVISKFGSRRYRYRDVLLFAAFARPGSFLVYEIAEVRFWRSVLQTSLENVIDAQKIWI